MPISWRKNVSKKSKHLFTHISNYLFTQISKLQMEKKNLVGLIISWLHFYTASKLGWLGDRAIFLLESGQMIQLILALFTFTWVKIKVVSISFLKKNLISSCNGLYCWYGHSLNNLVLKWIGPYNNNESFKYLFPNSRVITSPFSLISCTIFYHTLYTTNESG